MECVAGSERREDCHRESGSRPVWTRGRGGAAKSGHLRTSENQAGVRRKYFAGGPVRAVGKCTGRNSGHVACCFAGNARRETMDDSRRDASANRAGSDYSERCQESRGGESFSGFCEELRRKFYAGEVWVLVSGKHEERKKKITQRL